MIVSTRLVPLIFLMVCVGFLTGSAVDRPPRVRVLLTDGFGNAVPASRLVLSNDGSSTQVDQDRPFHVEYGQYVLEAIVPGGALFRERVTVDQPDQILTVAMKLGRIEDVEPPPCSILGYVTSGSAVGRIRLMQLFGPEVRDVSVSSVGKYEFRNLQCGDYLLAAMGTKECQGTRVVRATVMPARADLKITAGACDSARP